MYNIDKIDIHGLDVSTAKVYFSFYNTSLFILLF